MNSKALRELFPHANLTEKRLRDWADNGLIAPPILGSLGYGGGTINEYPDENIPRIELILKVNEGQKRIDVKKTQYSLIVEGFFLHGKNNGDSFIMVMCKNIIDEILDSLDENGDKMGAKYKNNYIKSLIFESFTTPFTIYDKFLPALRAAQIPRTESVFDILRVQNAEGNYVIEESGYMGDLPISPIAKFISRFNIYAIEKLIQDSHPRELETAFYNSMPLYNCAKPILGTLFGYDYGKLPDIEFFRDRLEPAKISMSKLEFEAHLRILAMFIFLGLRKDAKESFYMIENLTRYAEANVDNY